MNQQDLLVGLLTFEASPDVKIDEAR